MFAYLYTDLPSRPAFDSGPVSFLLARVEVNKWVGQVNFHSLAESQTYVLPPTANENTEPK